MTSIILHNQWNTKVHIHVYCFSDQIRQKYRELYTKYKVNLIHILVYRAFNICSSYSFFHKELIKTKHILLNNCFPPFLIDSVIKNFLNNSSNLHLNLIHPNQTNNPSTFVFPIQVILALKSGVICSSSLNLSILMLNYGLYLDHLSVYHLCLGIRTFPFPFAL